MKHINHIKGTKTIREVCLSLDKNKALKPTKADLLKELKKYGYTEQDFIDYFMSLSII